MGKDSPSPPATPDYAGAAQAQGAANVDTARLQARMSNPNIFGPLGNQTVSFLPDDSVAIFQTLNPAAQDTLNAQQRVQRSLAGLGEQGIGTASQRLSEGFNPNLPGIQTGIGNAGQISQTPDLSRFGQASGNINQQIGSAQDPQFQARMNELRAGGMQIARMNTPSKAELASLDDPFLARVNDRNSPRSLGQVQPLKAYSFVRFAFHQHATHSSWLEIEDLVQTQFAD